MHTSTQQFKSPKMSLVEMAIKENRSIVGLLVSFLFIRLVETTSRTNRTKYAVIGVPPWRELRVRDLYIKLCIEI